MKSIAYIISSERISELIDENLLAPILKGEHGAKVVAFYFVGDGVYHLVKGSRNAKSIKLAMAKEEISIYACKTSIKSRKIQNIIIDNVNLGTLKDFYDVAFDADYIVSL